MPKGMQSQWEEMIHIYWQANPNRPGSQGMCVFKYASLRVNYLYNKISPDPVVHLRALACGPWGVPSKELCNMETYSQRMSTDSLADVLTC